VSACDVAYLIICRAMADITQARRRTRRAHLEYILRHREHISFGGALLSPDGCQVTGVVLALEVTQRSQAEDFIRDEPYCAAGLFPQISIELWGGRIPEPFEGYLRQELAQELRLRGQRLGPT